jgi:predicted ATPase/DNA-binding XRE family transcriptional regulator
VEENLSFGYWVRRRRKALDLTQVELGKRVGASGAMIRKIEADERRPSRQLAELLASQLVVPDEERELFIQAARDIVAVEKLAISPHPISEPESTILPPSNLPVPLTSMVNRAPDLTAIKSLLLREDARLITITGPLGIGKTRLSIQAAEEILPEFADGAWFVDLSAVSDPELVLPTVAMTLDLPTETGLPPLLRVHRMLRDKQILLVLDNLEQVVDQAAMDVSNLLRQCRGVKVLATSRKRLDIYGEHEYALPPMSVPPLLDSYSLDDVINYEAVQLLVTRTRQHRPNFEVTAETARPIAEICQQMDGLPLALELAAARLRDMPVNALAEALRQASGPNWLALLSWSAHDMPSRQRTLLNAIAWSYMLLEPAQQDMFRQLGAFSGSFDWPAIAAVVDLPTLADEAELRATFNQLVDHNLVSLVSRVPERWRLLEMIREFARTELDPNMGCNAFCIGFRDQNQRGHCYSFGMETIWVSKDKILA